MSRWVVLCLLITVCGATGQEFRIGIIDLYGLNRVAADEVRRALTFKEGDTISLGGDGRPAFLIASENRVEQLPGVVRARTRIVCCDQGRAIVYVGVEESGAITTRFRDVPAGGARLVPDIVQGGGEFSRALMQAVQRGDAEEDRSEGHALNRDPAMRAIQDRFLVYAMFPRANVSVRLHWGPNRQHPMLVLGHSIFNRSCKTNVGELAARYGGGGHRGAGSVALMDDPEQQIRMILAELKANG